MTKLFMTHLFAYRTEFNPKVLPRPNTYLVYGWGSPHLRIAEQTIRINPHECSDNELYSFRNQALESGAEGKERVLKQFTDEITKRGAVHPMLDAATREQVKELEDRTIATAVVKKLKNAHDTERYRVVLEDIKLWKAKHELEHQNS